MTYRIAEVRLSNFKSHENTRVRLPSGTVALLGQNGAGKSSILEAVRIALAVDRRRVRGLSSLVNERRGGSFTITVILEPVNGGQPVEALVRAGKGGGQYTLKVGGKIVASGLEAYRTEVSKVLGLQYLSDPASFIERAVIVKQGGLQEIAEKMDKGGRELREEIEAAIGIPDYREALKRLDQFGIPAGEGLQARLTSHSLRRISKAIIDYRRRVEEKKREAREARERIKRLEEAAGELKREKKRLDEEVRRLEKLEARLDAILEEEKRAEREILDRRRELARLRDRLKEAEEARKSIPRLEELAGLQPLLDELDSLTIQLKDMEARYMEAKRLTEAARIAEETRDKYMEYLKVEEELKDARSEREKAHVSLKRLEALASKAEREVKRLQYKLDKLLKEAEDLAGTRLMDIEDLDAYLRRIQEKKTSLEEEVKSLEERLSQVRAIYNEKKRALDLLQHGSTGRCPVCGRELDEEHAEKVKRRILEELERLRKEEEEAARGLRRTYRELEELERLEERLTRLLEAAKTVKGELEEAVRASVPDSMIREARRRYEEAEMRVRELEERAEALRTYRDKHLGALQELKRAGVSDPGRLKEEAEELRLEVEEARGRLEELKREILSRTGAQNLQRARSLVRDASIQLARARVKVEEEDLLRREVEEKERIIASLEEKLEELKREKEELEEEVKEYEAKRKRLEGLEEEIRKLEAEASKLHGSLDKLEEEARELKDKIRELERVRRLVKAGIAARSILARLEEALYKRSVLLLEEEMSRILDTFNLDPARVELKEEHGGPKVAVITRSGGIRSVGMLSGGERTSVALAYVLALNKMMGSRIGFLALDEPTSELDQERRRVLVDLLSGLTGDSSLVSQLIIVTHHEDVMDSVDTVCRVRKESGRSLVECG